MATRTSVPPAILLVRRDRRPRCGADGVHRHWWRTPNTVPTSPRLALHDPRDRRQDRPDPGIRILYRSESASRRKRADLPGPLPADDDRSRGGRRRPRRCAASRSSWLSSEPRRLRSPCGKKCSVPVALQAQVTRDQRPVELQPASTRHLVRSEYAVSLMATEPAGDRDRAESDLPLPL
jgi:hypothetical protein